MKKIDLSKRMKVVADMVEPCQCVADIGCDHAFVSIYLALNNIAAHVIASDVRPGPIEIARRNVGEWGLSHVIDIRLNDGLTGIKPGEADTIIIAGMGGMLMIDILSKNKEVADASKTIVLQPQSDVEKVRRYLLSCGYIIADEDMIIDMGKYYNIIKARVPEEKIYSNKAVPEEKIYSNKAMPEEKIYSNKAIPENSISLNEKKVEDNVTVKNESLLTDISMYKNYSSEYNDVEYRYGRILLEKQNEVLKEYLTHTYEVNKQILTGIENSQSASAIERRNSLREEQNLLEQALLLM